jgi:tRNA(Arg) A34 adenosine deaminase TadA
MIQHAIREAQKSIFKYRFGAVVTRKGRIVGRGHNQLRHHDLCGYPFNNSLHAEAAAIRNMRAKGDTIYVARTSRQGVIGNSRPCVHCLHFISLSGIRWVVYTTPNGTIRSHISDLYEQQGPSETDCTNDGEEVPALFPG